MTIDLFYLIEFDVDLDCVIFFAIVIVYFGFDRVIVSMIVMISPIACVNVIVTNDAVSRVENFALFEKLDFGIISKISSIPTERIRPK